MTLKPYHKTLKKAKKNNNNNNSPYVKNQIRTVLSTENDIINTELHNCSEKRH